MPFPRIFPAFPRPRNLKVFCPAGLSWEKRLALGALQGLTNRTEPRMYQITGPWDEHWLEYYRAKFGVPNERISDPMDLLRLHGHAARGTVIFDTSVPDTANLAVTIAGLEDLIPAAGDLASELESCGLKQRRDLEGKFDDRISAYSWAREELLPKCNKRILGSLCVGKRKNWIQNSTGIIDYLVANRSLVIHLSAARRDREENLLFDQILEDLESPGVLMGWHCARDQEKEYVARAAKKGFFVLCSAHAPNLTVHGGIPPVRAKYVQRPPKPVDGIEKKIYLTLYMTDGDAIWAMNNLQSNNWLSSGRGSLPFNWGLLPLLYDIAPGMLEYYYETATERDYFVCPSSGAGYTYSFLHDDWYLHYSKHYMDLSGQIVANMVNWDTNFWWREVENPQAVYREKRILKPVGLVCGLGGSVYATSYPKGTPKVHSSLVLNVGEDCARRVANMATSLRERPLFIFAFVQIARGVLDHLVENLKSLPSEVEILNMDTFMMTLREAARQGLVDNELYPSKAALAQVDLTQPGSRNKPAAKSLLLRLADVARMPDDRMLEAINLGNWHNLASHEPSSVQAEMDRWRTSNEGYLPYDTPNLADALGYALFYSAWAYVRACLNTAGRYANHMDSSLDEYLELYPDPDNSVLEEIWEMWHGWHSRPPSLKAIKNLVTRAAALASKRD